MLMTAFACEECGTRVETAVSPDVLHCPVCKNRLFEESERSDPNSANNSESVWPVAGEPEDQEPCSLRDELRKLDDEWAEYQQTQLFRPARGPERPPSKRRALARVILFAMPLIIVIQQLLAGHGVIAMLVLAFSGYGIFCATMEYVMAENREVAELVYETKRENLLQRLDEAAGLVIETPERV